MLTSSKYAEREIDFACMWYARAEIISKIRCEGFTGPYLRVQCSSWNAKAGGARAQAEEALNAHKKWKNK